LIDLVVVVSVGDGRGSDGGGNSLESAVTHVEFLSVVLL
jgi:hypothetical protein